LVVLQNPTDLENVQGLGTDLYPASFHDACQAISIKAEELSDAEEEEDPPAITLPGIKAEAEVSCVCLSMLGEFHKYTYSLFYELLLQ
jgi:hypothetical protein